MKMTTRTIDTLLEIMADSEMSTHRRIEAAEALLGFEAPGRSGVACAGLPDVSVRKS